MSRQIALFGLIALAGCAGDTRSEEPGRQRRVPANLQADQDFIQKAASGGIFEVESSRLALSQQSSDETMEFAQTMIRDHSQANDKLKELAKSKGVDVSERMMPEHQQKLERLRSAQGDQFNQMYEQIQSQAHQETIQLFERCSRFCQDLDVREYATNTLPTLRNHMRHIREMAAATPQRQPQQTPQPPQQPEEEEHEHEHEHD